jgi:branched-chain amino acid transport system substrate-binding protein
MRLAVDDINAAGGTVTATTADTATNPATGREAAARLLGEGADVIVGPATSAVTQAVIQGLFDERVPQCTPSAQSPALSTQENAAYFFRTVPPAHAVAPIMARVVAEDGGTRVAIVGRADDYGIAISGLVAQILVEFGAEAEVILYDPGSTTFDAQVAAVVDFAPDAIVNVGFFFDGTSIVHGLIEAGFGPAIQYGGDALFHPFLWRLIDPNDPTVLDGMKFIGVAGSDEFNTRISDITDGNVNFAAQSYDCVVLLALAAEIAGGTDGDAMMEAIAGLTHEGVECSSYAECVALIDVGEDIDYVGVSGPINLTPNGDPTTGSYAVFQFQGGRITTLQAYEIDLTQTQ